MVDVPEHDPDHPDVDVTSDAGVITERDFVLMLISLYKDFPVLWKVKSKDYMDKNKSSNALQSITKSLRIYKPTYTEDQLKKKINTLRTNFNKEKNKIDKAKRSGASADDVPQPTLWYYNEMLFLNDQMDISETISSEQLPLQQKEQPQKRCKKTPIDDLVDLASKYFKRPDNDSDVIAKSWAVKLNRLAPDQRCYAEKMINDILFEGEMGTLTRNGIRFLQASSTSFNNSPGFYSTPSPNSVHATDTSPMPYQSPEPNQSSMPYQSPTPHQLPAPNQSRIPYQLPASNQSPVPYQSAAPATILSSKTIHARNQSPVPSHQSPTPKIKILSSQTLCAPNQSLSYYDNIDNNQSLATSVSPTPNEEAILIHIVDESLIEDYTEETQSAAKFIENYSSF